MHHAVKRLGECGEDDAKACIIVHSLYGLKSAGAAFHSLLAQILKDISYTSMKTDPNVWLLKVAKDDGFEYYKMLFVYVNDILALSHRTKDAIHQITKFYRAKEGSVKPPKIYLGANISKMQLPDGREVWTTSPKACLCQDFTPCHKKITQ
jgi:hypothetical protein